MDKQTETLPKGHYNLQCLECRFKQKIICNADENMNDVVKKAEKVCKTHLENLKHKKMIIDTSTYLDISYVGLNNNNNNSTIKPKIKGRYIVQCVDCAFNETGWSDSDEGKNGFEVLDLLDAHRNRFNHKRAVLIITTFGTVNYDKTKDSFTVIEPSPDIKYTRDYEYDTFQ